jgi:hypothetical protein
MIRSHRTYLSPRSNRRQLTLQHAEEERRSRWLEEEEARVRKQTTIDQDIARRRLQQYVPFLLFLVLVACVAVVVVVAVFFSTRVSFDSIRIVPAICIVLLHVCSLSRAFMTDWITGWH